MYLTQKKFWPILGIIDLLGSILFFWKTFKKPPLTIKKVLFIRLEHIGDMVMSTPVFETWKKNNPSCEIHVLCKTITKPIIAHNPYVNKIYTFDPSWMLKRSEDQTPEIQKIITALQKENYDIIFEMHGDPRNIRLAQKIGQSKSYMVGYACRGLGFLLHKKIFYDTHKHMIMQNLELIKPFCKKQVTQTKIYTDEPVKKKCNQLLKKYHLQKKNFIIINPRSGRVEKDLTISETKEYIQQTIEKYSSQKSHKNIKIVLTGSQGEKTFNNQFVSKTVINLSGETDLLTLVEFVTESLYVIAPDTGIIHIAKAVGTPFHALYKTTDVNIWGYENNE